MAVFIAMSMTRSYRARKGAEVRAALSLGDGQESLLACKRNTTGRWTNLDMCDGARRTGPAAPILRGAGVAQR
jgi:hypothetical protein